MSLANKLTEERRRRLAAERLLELKQAELTAANRKLGQHAQQLTEEIVETRAQVETIRGENIRVKSDLTVANEKTAIAERRLWHSIKSIKDGFAFFNTKNEMIMANPSYLAIFDGLSVIRPGVNYVTILQMLTDEGIVNTGDLAPRPWRDMMTQRFEQPNPEPVVMQLWNGHHIKLLDQRGPDGDVVSLCLDITTAVAHEKELKEARSIAESANRAKSAFLANMSHEIRTPMNGVVGMAEVLRDSDLTDEQQLYVDTIRNSGEALLVIINDVLDYSKIEAKKLDLHPEPFDLERAIQEVLMLLQPSARDKGLSLLLDYDLFLPTEFIGDPGRLRQVMTNLIGNAIKFTARGHVLVRVTGVPHHSTGDVSLHITIEDTGIGIPAEMVDHIFGEFNQVENERNRQFDGTGLGLAITQRLVEMMGGKIWVTSEEGRGSCFAFKLDIPPAHTDATPLCPLPEGLTHVVVVDNLAVNRAILERQFGQLGLQVTACADTGAAFAALDDNVTLVVTTHQPPVLDGFALANTIREAGNDVPLILLCAHPEQVFDHPQREHVHSVLRKPLPRADLFEALRTLPPKPSASPATPPVPLRPMRIMAAEDNRTNQLVFQKMIKDLDIELTLANNGEEAVSLFRETAPDLVFMDISMPKMDGKEAAKAIRSYEKASGKHTQIVALTAHAMTGDSAQIMSCGLDHYLTKPLRKPDIVAQIEGAHSDVMLPLYPQDHEVG